MLGVTIITVAWIELRWDVIRSLLKAGIDLLAV